ncbi:RimK family alpha-L-glutamate ligase [Candidatus Woesearchaeota archaeon]|nr:MAG: RimK family alpha-L-glutamate ligase [Candidatus Woesearchaeota archaeon]
MKFALISLGGKSSQLLLEKAKEHFDIVDDIDIRKVYVQTTTDGQKIFYESNELKQYDCVLIRGSFRYQLLQTAISTVLKGSCYMPLSSQSFNYCHNKFSTLLALHKKEIPIPTTHYAPKLEVAKKILETVNYPIIIKIPEGTQGKGVMFADSLVSAKSVLDTLSIFKQPFLIQEYIETNATDVRAIVVGDKVVAAMRRRAQGDELRANLHMGGVGEPYELDYKAEQIAVKTAKAVGAEICGVDLLEGRNTYVLEVNTSPGLMGITEATKLDIAGMMMKYVYEKTKEFVYLKKKEEYSEIMGSLTKAVNQPKEIYTNLDVVDGVIRLPRVCSKLAGLAKQQEVVITVKKDNINIKHVEDNGGGN